MKTTNRVISTSTLEDCAKMCNEELRFECFTFDFCYVKGECRLSLNSEIGSIDVVNDGQCDVYESKYEKLK